MKYDENKIYTVNEYIEVLNIGLKAFRLKLTGEVSGISKGPTGHVYFSLKDKDGGAIISCKAWKSSYRLFSVDLENGMEIVAIGTSDIYAPRGNLSFTAESIELVGEGALKKEYEKLKAKLTTEGLFEIERKRAIPKYPHKIGIITSLRSGVVVADFMNNLGRFGFKVLMKDARVEGQEAVVSLLESIKLMRKQDIEVLVIMRGGGSLESLIAFNNEALIREVAGFPVPVIAAIGHDVDVPLMALAADREVSTPTAAANFLSSGWEESALLLEKFERGILYKYESALEQTNELMRNAIDTVLTAGSMIRESYENKIENFYNIIISTFELRKAQVFQNLEYAEKLISTNDPNRQLRLGYSIATIGGKVVRSTSQVKVGSALNVRVKDGTINTEVKNITKQ